MARTEVGSNGGGSLCVQYAVQRLMEEKGSVARRRNGTKGEKESNDRNKGEKNQDIYLMETIVEEK